MTPRTADALLDVLVEIALEPGTAEPNAGVGTLAWAGHAPDSLAAAWEPFRTAVLDREAADGDDAMQAASARVDDAYRVLAWGPAQPAPVNS